MARNGGKTVLTTGANSGIGLSTVIELARRGYRSIGSVRSEAKADLLRRSAAEAGVEVEAVLLDVTDPERCEAVMADLPLYGLVNNAGYGVTGSVEDVGDDEAHQAFETMVFAPMRLARLALPAMRAAGEGRIVNVSSIYGRATTPLTGWYQGAKHALEGLSDALRMEVASSGVKVVVVEPGGFKTGIWDEREAEIERRGDTRFAPAYRRSLTLERAASRFLGDPGQVATVVAAACDARSPRARYLVGADAQGLAVWTRVTPTPVKDLVTRLGLGL